MLRRTPRPIISALRRFYYRDYLPPQKRITKVSESASYSELAELCRSLLKTSLTDFYLPHGVDREYGGFHETMHDNEFVTEAPKHIIFQARQVWYVSTLVDRGFCDRKVIEVAARGFDFVATYAEDRDCGGVYYSLSRRGEVKDSYKSVYAHAFVIYGAAALFRATRRPEALQLAQRLFHILEDKAHDRENGGYFEWFNRDWSERLVPQWGGPVPEDFAKTFNTHLHLLEAFAELYRVWPESQLRERLTQLLALNMSTMQFGADGTRIDFFRGDWSPIEDFARISYGHECELIWMALDAVELLGLSPTPYMTQAQKAADSTIRLGSDRSYGGLYYAGPPGKRADDILKVWWVQAEAMVAFLWMFRLTGEARYYTEFLRTFRFVDRQVVAPGGGWWAETRDDGSRRRGIPHTGPWQAAYHGGRCLMLCADMLDQLSEATE